MKHLLFSLAFLPAFAHAAFEQVAPELFVWKSTCNSYILREGESALMIDLGDGSVLDHLGDIGVKKVEALLLTGHHRELLQGVAKLDRSVTQLAAPKDEQAFFETPTAFRKWHPRLGDKFTVHGSSYVRPPRNRCGWIAGWRIGMSSSGTDDRFAASARPDTPPAA